ncbi:hypothetical protein PG996_008706 [Apiospora saccharicola]|uniref:Uncharacterized protein n=1 Tax=Apiospora saccharicola TaxID=335842 RepID=A0ABR1V1V0_9PEZI
MALYTLMELCPSIYKSDTNLGTPPAYSDAARQPPNPFAGDNCFTRKREEAAHPLGKYLLDLEPAMASACHEPRSGDLKRVAEERRQRKEFLSFLVELPEYIE